MFNKMKSAERENLQRCFVKTQGLFSTRKQSESWADNIIDGSDGLKTPREWKHFYVWLANPRGYDEERTERMEIDTEPPCIESYDDCMKVETFQNGTETIINVINPGWGQNTQDDEKVAV